MQQEPLLAVLIVVSDRAASGDRVDRTAPMLEEALRQVGISAGGPPVIVPDEKARIATAITEAAANAALVLTTGGTGIASRDVTPEATRSVLDREIPGLPEAMRAASRKKTPTADLSRALAGVCGQALVVNLPGSPDGARECLLTILPQLTHAVRLIRGSVRDCGAELSRGPEIVAPDTASS
ncbi:MAG: MogA/MoaB family molybdenum cofactor biosynthesis protein [Planctomycetota bacterium]